MFSSLSGRFWKLSKTFDFSVYAKKKKKEKKTALNQVMTYLSNSFKAPF